MQFIARQADFDQIVTEFLKERGDSGGEIFLQDAVGNKLLYFPLSFTNLFKFILYRSKKLLIHLRILITTCLESSFIVARRSLN